MLILSCIIVLLFSAFFSGLEIAFVSSSKLRVEMDKASKEGVTSRILSIFYAHPNNFISTLLVGNNIALVIYGILMAQIIDRYVLEPTGLQDGGLIQLTIQTLVSTAIVLVTGEFLPKTIFHLNPNGMMNAFALPAYLFYIVLYPISKFTSSLSKFLLWTVGAKVKPATRHDSFTRDDLDDLIQRNIDNAGDESEINEEVKIFQNALDFADTKVRDCIVPRTEIDAVALDTPLDVLKNQFIESGHSKIIVYREDIDDIAGFVHSSEMFRLRQGEDWTKSIREIPIVPETMTAQRLMKQFMQEKKSMAVVVDEFGGTSGIVTLEDLMEEVLGEIEDEHDSNKYVAKEVAKGEYLLSARMEIEAINERFDLDLPESEEYLTLGGLILHEYQSFPKLNEVVKFGHWEFKIVKNTTTKIELVRLKVVKA
ncbi:MAG: HlyC/CorC family transporter [Bacteroidaceae bacterium]|nr:HlyC/CorC family transporter [Bacteroidaceae bacterium]MBR1789536.1 HlyC/CorC family transporter [Bacteroidaceae bacterium]